MNKIYRAIEIANHAHTGQFDKAGMPYIFHPLRVASNFKDEDCQIVAILHDVIEDGGFEYKVDIKDMSECHIFEAVIFLTRGYDESYMDFIKQCKTNEISRKVKIADLKDNMDLSRLKEVTEEDLKRFNKYQKALKFLED